MIPGSLAAMAAVLLSGREDWFQRIPLIGFFGALGWSFGGSISYMQVIAYTHSGHSASVLYGFACLFVIGFLWAATGGAGTVLAATFSRERVNELFPAIIAVFVGWTLQDLTLAIWAFDDSDFRHESPLYWFDTDWVGVLVAMISVAALAAMRRKWDEGCSLVLYMALGWWVGFLLLVNVLGLRMTPPRGDNWAGILGMVGGLWVFLWRRRDQAVLWASITAGFWGGFGFAFATLLKLLEVKTGLNTNWHSVLEQSYGFINGLGMAYVIWQLARRAPVTSEVNAREWTTKFSVIFVLLGITYLNLAKNPAVWIKAKSVPAILYGISASAWFAIAYLLLLALLLWMLAKKPAFIPATPFGRGQLLLLVLLWWMVVGNFERAVVGFAEQRLITEGVIFLNAVILSFLIVRSSASPRIESQSFHVNRAISVGVVASLLTVLGSWITIRAVYGNTFAGHANLHVRFGTNGPAAGPIKGRPHP